MIPIVAQKQATISSGKADVVLGFVPDYVEITNTSVLSLANTTSLGSGASAASLLTMKGRPGDASSAGNLVGTTLYSSASSQAQGVVQVDNSVSSAAAVGVLGGPGQKAGVKIDLSSVTSQAFTTPSSSATMNVLAFRENS